MEQSIAVNFFPHLKEMHAVPGECEQRVSNTVLSPINVMYKNENNGEGLFMWKG